MYVVLPLGWWQHPFARNSFLIDSDKLLREVQQYCPGDVQVDTEKSRLAPAQSPSRPADPGRSGPPPLQEPPSPTVSAVSQQIAEILADSSMDPQDRAKSIYAQSQALVRAVLDEPNAGNIQACKTVVGEVVRSIVADKGLSSTLLAVSAHDYSTYTHSVNVGLYAALLASEIYRGSANHNLRELGAGFFLHDLGKTRIDLAIINKQGRLTDEEMHQMRQHPLYGDRILVETRTATPECRVIAMQHHERHNGTGYPHGLRGDQIHDYARICSIADVFDALVSRRPYKNPMTPIGALSLMREKMLDHFHRGMFESFVSLVARARIA